MGDHLWVGIPSRYVTSQLGQLSLPSLRGRKIEYQAGGKDWNVTPAGWLVTLCDPIWHVSSSSGEAASVAELLCPCYFTYYFTVLLPVTLQFYFFYFKTQQQIYNKVVAKDPTTTYKRVPTLPCDTVAPF